MHPNSTKYILINTLEGMNDGAVWKKNNIHIVNLDNFFLNNAKFRTKEKLNEIKKLLTKKKQNNTKEEIQEQALEDLKKKYQQLNKCWQDRSIIMVRLKNKVFIKSIYSLFLFYLFFQGRCGLGFLFSFSLFSFCSLFSFAFSD